MHSCRNARTLIQLYFSLNGNAIGSNHQLRFNSIGQARSQEVMLGRGANLSCGSIKFSPSTAFNKLLL